MHKDDVIATLREMADLLEIAGANAFEVMAYRNGAQSLEDWYGELQQAVAAGTLTEIPAIGKGLARVIAELVASGTSDELVRVRWLVPPGLPALLGVRGLGPKRVRALWQELGIESPGELRRAADDGRLQSLRGFGAKMVERVVAGLDYLQRAERRPATTPGLKTAALPQAPAASGRLWAGMSGYSYPQWKGTFYPDDARSSDFLEHYARRLSSVEINNTFYHFPSQDVVAAWRSQTPAHFRFAIKAHRRITHQLRLSEAARGQIADFVERCGQLGSRLGCILFQLPPDFARDDARLETLLSSLPPGPRYAVEFRHESWFADEVEQRLRRQNVACVAGDSEDHGLRRPVTADFVYTRLRRGSYTESEWASWDEWFGGQVAQNRDVLVYLKHDDAGTAPNVLLARWGHAQPPQARQTARKSRPRAAGRTTKRPRKTG